ncbi:molybdopterin synthase sulfur carrier subunit [Catenovulum sp. 2E275]|uniref:molybdopterin synthase sulfur carrier subunit n=1 Tax=Catenovulum sp. 2E275 TaxID=2980497 RepID=UPI0021CDF17F|nr:molybdopterin synthase sulfur carrier subunit [Catenovulum sp. 2E275]MCU4674344.1 molybdopterin synthase sulfur carrier subunit [Catenovulum sp. 2E275]
MIKVLFFARLREELGCESIELTESCQTLEEVKQAILNQHPNWQTTFTNKKLLAAVNQTMAQGNMTVKAGDEVAFFPPVTGG